MKEIQQIIKAFELATANGKRTALATVVHVEGSSYRRPGARMLVTDEGEITGAISGGCLEGDALRKAQLVIAQQTPKLVTYDTRDDDDAFIGRQLGCAGVISVLFEPIDVQNSFNAIECLKQVNTDRTSQVILTIFSFTGQQIGTCYWQKDQKKWGRLPEEYPTILHDIDYTFQQRASQFIQYKNSHIIFFDFIPPRISLIIAGAGNDVFSLSVFADVMGWEVHILDGRATHATQDRFPAACHVMVGKPEQLVDNLSIDERTAIVLMTHNYQYDLSLLRLLVTKKSLYIGILGPSKKRKRLLDDIGIELTSEEKKHIYGPTGLNIGAETPEEIALSIIAEIQSVLHDKKTAQLRDLDTHIHDRTQTKIQNR